MENEHAAWTSVLRRRAAYVDGVRARERRQERIADILSDPVALHCLVYRWDVFVAYCVRSERHPQIMARDPECIDAGLIELRATAACIPESASSRIHRILAELNTIASRTRPFRRQCALASGRTPTDA